MKILFTNVIVNSWLYFSKGKTLLKFQQDSNVILALGDDSNIPSLQFFCNQGLLNHTSCI